MKELIKFPSIEQFRNVIKDVQFRAQTVGYDQDGNRVVDRDPTYPKLKFIGTVKIHGTNACIGSHEDDVWYQSRERIITPESDNAGFATAMTVIPDQINDLFSQIRKHNIDKGEHPVLIFGEWCGGNVQAGVGVTGLPKMFVVFSIKVNDQWLTREDFAKIVFPNEQKIFSIYDFPTWEIEIDFALPTLVQNQLGELTLAVEAECPVAKYFGNQGIGEGIVWKCVAPFYNESRYWFKVKGEKHSVSKVKTLAPVDVEKVQSMNELIETVLTENRLKQGIDKLREMGKEISEKSTGDYIRWIHGDIVKEELDRIVASGFEPKDLGKPVSTKARQWFFSYIDSNAPVIQ